MSFIDESGTVRARRPLWEACSLEKSLRQTAGPLGELLADTAGAVADACYLSAAGSTHAAPLDVKCFRAYERFEATARARIVELSRRTRSARGETAAWDFDAQHSDTGAHPLTRGEFSESEADEHGLGEGLNDE